MTLKTYYNPVEVLFGINSLLNISEIVQKYTKSIKNAKILIVTDKNLLNILGISEKILELLEKDGFIVEIFEKEGYFSSIKIIDNGANLVRNKNYNLIIGIGGGSAMDTAKCMAILGNNPGSINLYLKEGKTLENYGIPLIEVPTTSGTGSEVTRWATVWDLGEKQKKYSLSDLKMYAKGAIIDPTLVKSLPKKMSVITGLDAFSQAIEAYWSKNHNKISDIYALQAIPIIFSNLQEIFKDPSNIDIRKNLAFGSLLSGLAFSNTKTTAVHSVSYPITLHFNVPHGLACALTLSQFLLFNSEKTENNIDEAPDRLRKISDAIGADSPDNAAQMITNLMTTLNLPTKLHEVGIDKKGIELIIAEGFTPDRVKHNPRKLTEDKLRKILHTLL
ncbi:iron-containing alcohol dehydrogenase [Promethearchaeum syntrophicum]|uniref:Iron-containing alcohol dehydrogenase n=1 Tax=Promethearchaeum syntrophicum TaxID=2594042 RepID=A0A5B9D9M7_9ARCH|nr:iron-containing alcohol dehydrogenase [Candidatus Prometheoarchaeum syntrophicum]QEE15793.1 L-1,2-propanediol oxidoreductase [Candidatus Prometheoarchaeum syntrophicum]